ncbi:DNA-directed RNA polymerase subunit alpha [Gimesia panareensis]|nr:DNA-directed RNA polymerase subunit alpha [Gimesia panareensis]
MSVRTVNCLETNKVATIGELAQMSQEELMKIPNFGEKTLKECIAHLDRLKVPHPEWKVVRKQRKKKS